MANFKNDYFKKFSNEGIAFMEGRTAGDVDTLVGKEVVISDYGFIKDNTSELGKYAVFMVEGDEEHFFFGSSVVTDVLATVEEDGMKSALCGNQKIMLKKKTSKRSRREYTYIEFL